jgi:hypothetical protein
MTLTPFANRFENRGLLVASCGSNTVNPKLTGWVLMLSIAPLSVGGTRPEIGAANSAFQKVSTPPPPLSGV